MRRLSFCRTDVEAFKETLESYEQDQRNSTVRHRVTDEGMLDFENLATQRNDSRTSVLFHLARYLRTKGNLSCPL